MGFSRFTKLPLILTICAPSSCHLGNLYYALTHSPEPMTEEYSYALTWEAATERLEAAGCISMKEAEAMQELHASDELGIDVSACRSLRSSQVLSWFSPFYFLS